tara:strand:+ start:423 stop:644 length:222 start_codon:yes stop_codon:yes gene_type:complete
MTKRYAVYNDDGYYDETNLVEHISGDWVRYSDHCIEVKRLWDKITLLNQEVSDLEPADKDVCGANWVIKEDQR